MMEMRNIPRRDHVIMQENLATYLYQVDPQADRPQQLSERFESENSRWSFKAERELAQPYSDRQVLEHLGHLEERLRPFVVGAYPANRWVVCGSVAKGRAGANSDLDAFVQAAFTKEQVERLRSLPGWTVSVFLKRDRTGPSDPNLHHGTAHTKENQVEVVFATERMWDRQFEVNDATFEMEAERLSQAGSLRTVFREAFEAKGYKIHQADDGSVIVERTRERSLRHKEQEWPRNH